MNNLPYIQGTVFDDGKPFALLLMAFAVGMITGAVRDLFCPFFSKDNRVAVFFSDLFSVLFAYASLFTCALNENCGIIRWYHAACAAMGFFVYHTTLSPLVQKILFFILGIVKKCIHLILLPLLFLLSKGKSGLSRLQKRSLRHREKVRYEKIRKQWIRLAARGFDCVPSQSAGRTAYKRKDKPFRYGQNSI